MKKVIDSKAISHPNLYHFLEAVLEADKEGFQLSVQNEHFPVFMGGGFHVVLVKTEEVEDEVKEVKDEVPEVVEEVTDRQPEPPKEEQVETTDGNEGTPVEGQGEVQQEAVGVKPVSEETSDPVEDKGDTKTESTRTPTKRGRKKKSD